MDCDRYLELLSARLDGELTESEKRELEAHLASCPECRAMGAQLEILQSSFAELEDIPAPEGFPQSVMNRIRESEPKKTIPLFRRPMFKALAGLAACAVLAVGLYGVVCPPRQNSDLMMTRNISQEALEETGDVSDFVGLRSVPDEAAVYDSVAALPEDLKSYTEVLVLDHMPEGGWEFILPDAYGSVDGLYVTGEVLEQINQMAQEQGITASITSGTGESSLHLIVVLDES